MPRILTTVDQRVLRLLTFVHFDETNSLSFLEKAGGGGGGGGGGGRTADRSCNRFEFKKKLELVYVMSLITLV